MRPEKAKSMRTRFKNDLKQLTEDAKGEKAAEHLSMTSYEDAVEEYRSRAPSGLIFFDGFEGSDYVFFGDTLADRLNADEANLRALKVRLEILNPDECEVVQDAFCLPAQIHYIEYTYVGSGGNARVTPLIGSREEADRFDEDERFESCDETDTRERVVSAIANYCTSAAAMCKILKAYREERLFLRVLLEVKKQCQNPDESDAPGMGDERARLVCGWFCMANEALWSQIQAQKRIDEWEEIDRRLKSPGGGSTPPVADNANPPAKKSDLPPIVPGKYASKFAEFDNEKSVLILRVGPKRKCQFPIPPSYRNARDILKWLLESKDPDGWHEFDNAHAHYRGNGWRPQFTHGKIKDKMRDLLRYIYSRNKKGEHGATALRISPKPRPPAKHGISKTKHKKIPAMSL